QFTSQHLKVLKQFLDTKDIPLDKICNDIRSRMPAEVRVQLVHYMFGIAKADGDVAESEMNVIQNIAQKLGVSQTDFESLKNMFYRDVNSDYKILGVDASATDDQIKKAYRKMAIAHHPDKVASMGEEYQKGAQEKFMKIQEAYENIKKKRGFK
ncbi:MAG: DnaJ domain-containing protein, partial [Flavobacteriales bacterium]|nr:DnaJ domain-containing protein [Flavobacteriales bacterium]